MTTTPERFGTDASEVMGVDHLVHKPVPGRILHDLIAEVRERSSLHQRRPTAVVPERDHA